MGNNVEQEPGGDFADFYETLQLRPTAGADTIECVCRLLAQRFHPKNQKTSDESAYQAVLAAYRVLIDPERRAAYDAEYADEHPSRWTKFDHGSTAQVKNLAALPAF